MTTSLHSANIIDALQQLDDEWRRMRLSRADREDLGAEVAADLEAAAADGVDPVQLLGPDLARFARESAEARGVLPEPPGYGRVLAGGGVGLVLSIVLAYLVTRLLYDALVPWVDWSTTSWDIAFAVLITLSGTAGTLAGLRTALSGRWAGEETVPRAAVLLLPVVGAAAVLAAVYAHHQQGATDPLTVLVETAVVLIGWFVALVGARGWALRSARPVTG